MTARARARAVRQERANRGEPIDGPDVWSRLASGAQPVDDDDAEAQEADADARADGALLLQDAVQKLEEELLDPCGGPLGERIAEADAAIGGGHTDDGVFVPPCRALGPLKLFRLWTLWTDPHTGKLRPSWSTAMAALSALFDQITPPPPPPPEPKPQADQSQADAASDADARADSAEEEPPPPPPRPPLPPAYLVIVCSAPLVPMDERFAGETSVSVLDPSADDAAPPSRLAARVAMLSVLSVGELQARLDSADVRPPSMGDWLEKGEMVEALARHLEDEGAPLDEDPAATDAAAPPRAESPAAPRSMPAPEIPMRDAHTFVMRSVPEVSDTNALAKKKRAVQGQTPPDASASGDQAEVGVAVDGRVVGRMSADAHAKAAAASATALREEMGDDDDAAGAESGALVKTPSDSERRSRRRRALGFEPPLQDRDGEDGSSDVRLARLSNEAAQEILSKLLSWVAAAERKRGETREVVIVSTSPVRSASTTVRGARAAATRRALS